MIYKVFSIRDRKGEYYHPRIEANEESAKRNFAMMVNTPDTLMNFSPSDFELYYVGNWDSVTATFDNLPVLSFIASGDMVIGVGSHEKS